MFSLSLDGFPLVFSGFLPQSKMMHVRLFGKYKWMLAVDVCVCLCVCRNSFNRRRNYYIFKIKPKAFVFPVQCPQQRDKPPPHSDSWNRL